MGKSTKTPRRAGRHPQMARCTRIFCGEANRQPNPPFRPIPSPRRVGPVGCPRPSPRRYPPLAILERERTRDALTKLRFTILTHSGLYFSVLSLWRTTAIMRTTGRWVTVTAAGRPHKAFLPNPLPPDPPLALTPEDQDLLERANRALGRLDGAADLLPDPTFLTNAYVRKEALVSSQIEGTQS